MTLVDSAPRHYITTFTGRQVVLNAPTPEMIDLEDIIHALSHICHFAGHTIEFFSVAQHSVCVARIVPPELRKWALFHDAAEAYIGDVSRPLKQMLTHGVLSSDPRSYKSIEREFLRVIAQKFELEWPEPSQLKRYDDAILALEAEHYMTDATLHDGFGRAYDLSMPEAKALPPFFYAPMTPMQARIAFRREYRRIFFDDDGF